MSRGTVTQTEFDVIVVGAGPAGSAASLSLARRGVKVLMLEKARVPGEKNMSGGIVYGDFPGVPGLLSLVPDFETSAPLERKILSHEVVFLDRPDMKKGRSRYYRLSNASLPAKLGLAQLGFESGHDYSVLRVTFDRWLADLAVGAGAVLSTETTVEGLLKEDGDVVGVRTTKEELRANLVIDSSGVTSNLVEDAGLRGRLNPRQLYHGVKRVYEIAPEAIEERFRVRKGEGRAVLFLGDFMHGIGGEAFIYTNRETLSVGLVVSLDSLVRKTTERFEDVGKLVYVLDEFEAHPMVAEILEGAKAVEYSAHNIPKGYRTLLKAPYADGYMATGDALGAFAKIGPMFDGMRRAITSGIMAASAYLQASTSGSFKAKNLSRYRALLKSVYEDVNRSGRDSFLSESAFTYRTLPRLIFATRILSSVYRSEPKAQKGASSDATELVLEGTNLLNFDVDEAYSHIKVDVALASKSVTKPWVPTCPTNCFTLQTSKGVFASFKDLYLRNLEFGRQGSVGGNAGKAFTQTLDDMASGQLRFDPGACISCGTCGAIGPREMVAFSHERSGHGVQYRYG
ncbi:MAG TPA: FAD-dependent oxidoreductase [Nitrososphaerales archaeon]|nr:FAD-dependent oxidoreductase [Nitrososphaerales archaeon]